MHSPILGVPIYKRVSIRPEDHDEVGWIAFSDGVPLDRIVILSSCIESNAVVSSTTAHFITRKSLTEPIGRFLARRERLAEIRCMPRLRNPSSRDINEPRSPAVTGIIRPYPSAFTREKNLPPLVNALEQDTYVLGLDTTAFIAN